MTDHSVPPPGTPHGSVFTGTAGLGARIGARLLDVLIVAVPANILLWIIGFGGLGMDRQTWVGSAVISLLWFGYFVFFESNRGATLGKQLLNLKVIDANGAAPATDVAAKRNVWMLFGLIPWFGGLLSFVAFVVIMVTISSNAHNRGVHDTFAGTAVMRT
ncbi:RDD family protein [Egicoccus sp. AB-alg6-2]|uniref:RDD family protein n=1 Tax=Egicoccus sp. AB-alg6-2 TaxID=3242692 RepID=UPI00359D99FD